MLLSMLQQYDHLMHEVLTKRDQSPCKCLQLQTHDLIAITVVGHWHTVDLVVDDVVRLA